jgi:alpha-tubulin suppressor-like RCC1 family protein
VASRFFLFPKQNGAETCGAGYNAYGQLGLDKWPGQLDHSRRTSFTLIDSLEGMHVASVMCGDHHSAVITRSGECGSGCHWTA